MPIEQHRRPIDGNGLMGIFSKPMTLFSPEFYATCALGGALSCGTTHALVTPLDLVKCRRQVPFKSSIIGQSKSLHVSFQWMGNHFSCSRIFGCMGRCPAHRDRLFSSRRLQVRFLRVFQTQVRLVGWTRSRACLSDQFVFGCLCLCRVHSRCCIMST